MVIELTQEQHSLLREVWQDEGGWTPGKDGIRVPTFTTFPSTPVELEQLTDSAEGITLHQLDVFRQELRNGHRCVLCAAPDDVFEIGLCANCIVATEDDE